VLLAENLKKMTSGKDLKSKLYEVVKALSAMRLCKEDKVPNAVLCRKVNVGEGERPFVPALPTAKGSVSEIALETSEE